MRYLSSHCSLGHQQEVSSTASGEDDEWESFYHHHRLQLWSEPLRISSNSLIPDEACVLTAGVEPKGDVTSTSLYARDGCQSSPENLTGPPVLFKSKLTVLYAFPLYCSFGILAEGIKLCLPEYELNPTRRYFAKKEKRCPTAAARLNRCFNLSLYGKDPITT